MKNSVYVISCILIVLIYFYFCYLLLEEQKKRTKLIKENINQYIEDNYKQFAVKNIPINPKMVIDIKKAAIKKPKKVAKTKKEKPNKNK